MLKNLQLYSYVLMAALTLAACSGSDGDPGPKGDPGDKGLQGDTGAAGEDAASKTGYFEGTITGARKDGTPFEETFKYEYVFGNEIFSGNDILLQRFETASGAIADAITEGSYHDKGYLKFYASKDGENIAPSDLQLFFTKGISATQLFQMTARPYPVDASYNRVIELSPEQNAIYNFGHGKSGQLSYYTVDLNSDGVDDANEFSVESTTYNTYTYDMETGNLVAVSVDGEVMQDGALFEKYNDIKFVYDPDLKRYVFVATADGTALYENVGDVPADEFSITNYTNVDGVISFDFAMTISKYRGYVGTKVGGFIGYSIDGLNSTGHDMTITGKFNSGDAVYTEIVGRIKQ
jgi:hypothetical protein